MESKIKKKIKKVRSNSSRHISSIITAVGAFVLIAAGSIIMIWQIYHLNSQNRVVEKISEIIPFPAARVNDSFIKYADYLKSLKAANIFFQKQSEQTYNEAELHKFVMDRLIFNEIVKIIAYDYKINVTNQEIENEIEIIIRQKGSRQEVEEFLQVYYGMSLNDYKKAFVEPRIYLEKVENSISDDESLNGEVRKNIQSALSRLRNGEQFEDIASDYAGSYLNREFFRGELSVALEDDLIELGQNEYTDVVSLDNSYQIIRLDSLDKEKGIFKLSGIVVPTITVAQLVEDRKQSVSIKIYLPQIN